MATGDKLNYLLETKSLIKTAIKNKGQSVSDSDSFRSYATKINNIVTKGSLGTNYSGWGDNNLGTKSFTFPASSTEAIVICTTIREGNDDTGTCTTTSGKVTALTTYGYSGGYNAGTYWKTLWWRVTKSAGTAATITVKITNPYGHVGASLQVVYN